MVKGFISSKEITALESVFKCPQCMKVRIIYSCLKCGSSSPSGKHYEFMAYPIYLSTDNKSDQFLYRQLFNPSGIFKLEISSGLEMLNATAQLLNHSFVEQQVLWKLGGALSEQGTSWKALVP